jgi:protein phosphatase
MQWQVTVGRLEDNTLAVADTEVSGHHVVIRWEPSERCWQVTDTGSLNGTFLNGKTISTNNRKQGREHRLSSDDMMQLGSYSKVR